MPEVETILVVDDYEDMLALAGEILTRAGYRVVVATDGEQAIEMAQAHSGEIDILLTDVQLPDMLGPDLAERIKIGSPRMSVIFMSGTAYPRLGSETAAILLKPFMAQELLKRVREALPPLTSGN